MIVGNPDYFRRNAHIIANLDIEATTDRHRIDRSGNFNKKAFNARYATKQLNRNLARNGFSE